MALNIENTNKVSTPTNGPSLQRTIDPESLDTSDCAHESLRGVVDGAVSVTAEDSYNSGYKLGRRVRNKQIQGRNFADAESLSAFVRKTCQDS
jgi:hypothetical protein